MVDYSPYQIRPNESFVDYIARLSNTRQAGILGTGGLMDVVAPQEKLYKTVLKAMCGMALLV
jgi:hypothetical protein